LLLQIPGVDVQARIELEKGSGLNEREVEILHERVAAAQGWLAVYAPDSARVAVRRDGVPEAAAALDAEQRRFLAQLSNLAGRDAPDGGDAWQSMIFSVAKMDDLPPRRAFEAIYLAFLGRPNGPRAGWLLASLDRDFVYERTWAASGWTEAGA
jgi:lysyl-tRNA synthetase class 1